MDIKREIVPKKNGSTTVINKGFASTTNNNPNIDTQNFSVVNLVANNINTNSIYSIDGEFENLGANNANITDLTLGNIHGNVTTDCDITCLSSEPNAFDKTVDLEQVNVKLGSHNTFHSLIGDETSELYANNITTDYLTVLRSAHFFELIIDKIKASGGSVLFTAADGFTIDLVTSDSTYYTLYWRACSEVAEGDVGDKLSDTGQTLTENVSINMWKQWDQALCQTFNLSGGAGTYQDVSNTYWWRVVQSVSDEPEIQTIDGVKYYCHWVKVYKTGQYVAANSDEPEVGNQVAMLGYRYDQLPNPSSNDIARANAIMISAYQTIDTGVKPPSYVQYQDITGFSLTTGQRKTYIDATGAHIVGKLEAGTTVDQSVNIPVVIDTWRIITDASIVTKDTNNGVQPTTIELSLLHNDGTNSDLIYTLPNDKAIYVNGVLNNDGLTITVSDYITTSSFGDLEIELTNTAYTKTFDSLTISGVEIDAANGMNGSYIQFIYQNNDTMPSTPQNYGATIPSGWSLTPSTPMDDELTWMSQRIISYNASNQPQYGNWTSPIRISGTNGYGTDGDGTEFIYYRTTTTTPPPLYQSYAGLPDASLLSDTVCQFQIRPGDPGYDSDSNLITIWKDSSQRTYSHIHGDFMPPSIQVNDTLDTGWTDEPQGVDSTWIYEWVSVRNYDGTNREWSTFSEPAIWAKYSKDGINGVNGQNGLDGVDGSNGEFWFLSPIKNDFSVRINNATNYESITGRINTDLAFGIVHVNGTSASYISAAEMVDYSIKLITDNTTDGGQRNNQTVTYANQTLNLDGVTIPVLTYSNNNYLTYTANTQAGNYVNYYYLYENQLTNRMSTKMTIALYKNNVQVNTYTIPLIFKPDHLFSVTEDALNSIYQGLSGDASGIYTTGFSSIRQQWNSINLAVNNMTKFANGEFPVNNEYQQYVYYCTTSADAPTKPSGNVTTNTQVYNQWTTYNMEATSTYKYVWYSERTKPTNSPTHSTDSWSAWSDSALLQTYGSSRGYPLRSYVDIQANRIKLEVEGELENTGIDITNGKINLNADNTNINGNLNVYNAKQGIIVYDSNNNPKISITADNLGGSYDSYSTNIGTAYDYLYESTTKKTAGASTYTAQIIDIELGYLKNNTELILNTSAGSTDPYNENNYILVKFYKSLIDGKYSQIVEGSITSASYSLTFSNGTSSISRSGNFTIDNSVPAYETRLYFPNINVTLNADGNWTISGNVTLILTGDKRTLECYYCGHQLFYIIGADAAVNKISLDGMLIKPSSNNINWFGSDMTAFSNGLHEIRITSNGIKERNYINSNTGTYNENPLSCSQTVQLVRNDGTSINDDATCVLLLDNLHPMGVLLPKPDSNNYIEGRTIYIKNESIQTHNIVADWYSSSSGIVIPKDSNFDDTMRNSRYDYGRYLPVPPKSQMTLICIHNENISVPRWYAF